MGGETARLMATDPPYGVSYVEAKKGIAGFKMKSGTLDIANDDLVGDRLRDFLVAVLKAALPHLDAAAVYLWHAGLGASMPVIQAAALAELNLHRQIIWQKPGIVLTRSGMYHWAHEPCFFGWFAGKQPKWYGPMDQRTVWNVGHDSDRVGHPTQKPAALFFPPIHNHTLRGEIVFEPFSGSGTQLIAATRTGRRCRAIELEPKYVDIAVRRWERFTGEKARLLVSNQTFDEVAASRRKTDAWRLTSDATAGKVECVGSKVRGRAKASR